MTRIKHFLTDDIQDDINEMDSVKIEEEPYDYVVEELVESQHEDQEEICDEEEQEDEEEEMLMVPLKRSRMENLETDDGMIYNCEICPKTFGKTRLCITYLI